MAQRVAVAIAIARDPVLVVADEPTASLDASIRGQIMALLASLPELVDGSVLILTHDLASVAGHCHRVVVMYAGRAVDAGSASAVFGRPAHPYTAALLASAPGNEGPGGRLDPIPGMHPILSERSAICSFAPRCTWVIPRCSGERPEPRSVSDQQVVCFRAEDLVADEAPLRG
jgi:oligopeptide/dipeptide ABC transporter ATP-binding protein